MAKEKDVKTNAMRILDRNKITYKVNTYECDEFIDGVHIAQKLGQSCEMSFKTLVTVGKSGNYHVFVLPVAEELDMKKAAKSAGEKSVEMLHVKDINSVTGYIRGGCSPLGMKKQYATVVDKSAEQFDEIIISGGRLGSQIFLDPKDLVKVTKGKFDDIIFR
ncbi:MAG: Cys-tRNA(Pro) deacylase [Hominimerdicola sp.]